MTQIPAHIAIIMDGNGRWAQAQGQERVYGHVHGVESVRRILKRAAERGVKVLSLYTFSEENWSRPQQEVDALMELIVVSLRKEIDSLMENGVRLRTIGNTDKLPADVQELLKEAIALTADNSVITLQLALSYSSRQEITHAVKELVADKISAEAITEEDITDRLYTSGIPDPDLIIRTGGEQRLSNFLLWQGAYAELYFCPDAWPAFDEKAFDKALEDFAQRERRYGKTSAQLLSNE
ncbi:UDP pyrophosphate synthase [Porphyromonas sp. COT-108 OH1349]|nr:UDP pyrophosphate synthase [Porphyromonas sp. COT-108 OH1349]